VSDTPKPTRRRPGRPTGQRPPEQETRTRILHAAADLFRLRGYAAVSIGEIATAVGVTKPTLYYHFSGKEAIYAAVMCWTLETIAEGVWVIARLPGSIRERLLLLAQAGLEHAPTDADLTPMMRDVATHLNPELHAGIAAAHEATLAAFDGVMRSGMDVGELRAREPRFLAHAYLHQLEALINRPDLSRDEKYHALKDMVDLFLDGAAARDR